MGDGDLSVRIGPRVGSRRGRDEVAELGRSFNAMATDLQRSTVRRDYFQSLFDSMSNAVLVTGPTAGPLEAAAVASSNPAAWALTGCDDAALRGRPLGTVLSIDADTPVRLDEQGRIDGVEGQLVRCNGSVWPVLITTSRLSAGAGDGNAGGDGVVFVLQDLTERRRAQSLERVAHVHAREMSVARQLQQSLLPLRQPSVVGFDIAGWSRSADATGGNYFDWLDLPDGRIVIAIADAAGHGIGSALLIATCRGYLRATAFGAGELAEMLHRVHKLSCDEMPAGRFVTAAACAFKAGEENAQFVSAGHGPTFYYYAREGRVDWWGTDDLPIGHMFGDAVSRNFRFPPGDVLLLLTDGFFEWENAADEAFGFGRVADVLRQHHAVPAEEIIDALYAAVLGHVGDARQHDDLTAVVIKRTG